MSSRRKEEAPIPVNYLHSSDDDSLPKIQRIEIAEVPLLTIEEEKNLTKIIDKGRTFHGKEKNIENMHLTPEAKEAFDHLIEANQRLVYSIAVSPRFLYQGVSFRDLFQEGNIGLMEAAAKFNPDLGWKFSTYATWWVRKSVRRAIDNQGRQIRIPVHIGQGTLSRLSRAESGLVQELHRDPTPEELSEKTGYTATYIQDLMIVRKRPLSLESPLDDEDKDADEFGDTISNSEEPIEEAVSRNTRLEAAISDIKTILNQREILIFGFRCGMLDGEEHTLEETGEYFGITRERIRQIEEKIKKNNYRIK